MNTVQVFDGSKWRTGPSLTARSRFGVTSFGGSIWVAGGVTTGASKNFDSVEIFDGKRWKARLRLVTATRGLALVSFGARLLAIGGYNSSYLKAVQMSA